MSYLVDILKTSSLGRLDSHVTLRDCSKEARGEPGYIEGFAGGWGRGKQANKQTKHVVKLQKMTASHKARHLRLMILVFFYVWEDAIIWAYYNHSFDMHVHYPGQYPLFAILHPLRVNNWGRWERLQWLMAGWPHVFWYGRWHLPTGGMVLHLSWEEQCNFVTHLWLT